MNDKILRDSLERNWIVTIIYQKGNEITQRNIEVKSIDKNKVRAYCHLRNQTRVFDLDNILAADYCRRIHRDDSHAPLIF
jgi:predicted DNA-binding transcriptional regulator YafY